MTEESLFLELGAGGTPRPGFLHIDITPFSHIEVVCSAGALPFKTNSFEGIFAAHLLEHFSFRRTTGLLREWQRVTRDWLYVIVPNFMRTIQNYNDHLIDDYELNAQIFGCHAGQECFHLSCFSPAYLMRCIVAGGFLWQIKIYKAGFFPESFYHHPSLTFQDDLHVLARIQRVYDGSLNLGRYGQFRADRGRYIKEE